MYTWYWIFCQGREGTCQVEIESGIEQDCGNHCDAAHVTGWTVTRGGLCPACSYPTPPDSESSQERTAIRTIDISGDGWG